MVYPPFYYVLVSPFAALSYLAAMRFWMLMLGGVTCSYFWLILNHFPTIGRRPFHVFIILVASLFFTPLLTSLTMAQKSVVLLLILTSTFLLLRNRKPLAAGVVFGLIAFKPHLGLPIGIAMLLKGQWRFVAGSAITVGSLVGICLATGPDLCVDYFNQCLSQGDYTGNAGYMLSEAQSLHAVCHLAFDAVSPKLALAIAGCLTLAVCLVLRLILKGPLETDSQLFGLQFASLVFATVLISPHFYQYDLTILLLPMMIIWSVLSGNWNHGTNFVVGETHRHLMLGLTLLLFFGASKFTAIASATNVQPSNVILLTLLVTVWQARQNPAKLLSFGENRPIRAKEIAAS